MTRRQLARLLVGQLQKIKVKQGQESHLFCYVWSAGFYEGLPLRVGCSCSSDPLTLLKILQAYKAASMPAQMQRQTLLSSMPLWVAAAASLSLSRSSRFCTHIRRLADTRCGCTTTSDFYGCTPILLRYVCCFAPSRCVVLSVAAPRSELTT